MKSCKEKAMCCGAGGAQMFKDSEKGNKAAGGRARKAIGEIKKLVTSYRQASVSESKSQEFIMAETKQKFPITNIDVKDKKNIRYPPFENQCER